jgi:hypothetical protein
MDPLIGTPQCPHLGFEVRSGRPCCRADEMTRRDCGRAAPNPAARQAREALDVEAHFCTVLGADALPPEALKLAAREKADAQRAARTRPNKGGFSPPPKVTGLLPAKPERPEEPDFEKPVIPTYTIRGERRKTPPNAPCPCGSGRKYKKCCGA